MSIISGYPVGAKLTSEFYENIMKVIEDNWGTFPLTETCTLCKSKVELESIRDCTYRPYSCSHFFERKEAFIWEWECPCCHEKNFIYVYV